MSVTLSPVPGPTGPGPLLLPHQLLVASIVYGLPQLYTPRKLLPAMLQEWILLRLALIGDMIITPIPVPTEIVMFDMVAADVVSPALDQILTPRAALGVKFEVIFVILPPLKVGVLPLVTATPYV